VGIDDLRVFFFWPFSPKRKSWEAGAESVVGVVVVESVVGAGVAPPRGKLVETIKSGGAVLEDGCVRKRDGDSGG